LLTAIPLPSSLAFFSMGSVKLVVAEPSTPIVVLEVDAT